MKKLLCLLCGLFLVLIATGSASALQLITNGDFETGNLDGWLHTNDAVIAGTDSTFGYGNYYAALDDSNSAGGEVIGQSFYVGSDIISLDISFDYLFSGVDDAVLLSDLAAGVLATINSGETSFDLTNLLFLMSSESTNFGTILHYTGSIEISSIADINPNAAIGFGLLETTAGLWDSTNTALGIDNVSVIAVTAPVPEPATILLLGLGLVGLAGISRKRKKT